MPAAGETGRTRNAAKQGRPPGSRTRDGTCRGADPKCFLGVAVSGTAATEDGGAESKTAGAEEWNADKRQHPGLPAGRGRES